MKGSDKKSSYPKRLQARKKLAKSIGQNAYYESRVIEKKTGRLQGRKTPLPLPLFENQEGE
jgi:hypothetical protein